MRGNHKNKQPVIPVYNRKIARNRLKKAYGNNKITKAWKSIQIKKYGLKKYIAIRLSKVPRGKGRDLIDLLYNS